MLDADEGARLLAALDLARFDVSAETPHPFDVSAETPHLLDVSAETPHLLDVSAETPHAFDVSAETPRTRADALMVLVESFLAGGARSRTGGTPYRLRTSCRTVAGRPPCRCQVDQFPSGVTGTRTPRPRGAEDSA